MSSSSSSSSSNQNNSNNCFCCRELQLVHPHNFSLKKFCFFLLIFLLITLLIIGLSTFFVILIIKPNKPIFSVRDLEMNFYQIEKPPNNDNNNQTLMLSSVISLSLNAENHNKFGIGYGGTRFGVYHEDMNIGSIRIPRFFQPPHSDDVVVQSRVLLECVNVTKILGMASHVNDMAEVKILGDVRAHLWLLHVNLFHIKVAMNCDMNVNLKDLTSTNGVYSAKVIKSRLAYALSNSNTVSMKCISTFSI